MMNIANLIIFDAIKYIRNNSYIMFDMASVLIVGWSGCAGRIDSEDAEANK